MSSPAPSATRALGVLAAAAAVLLAWIAAGDRAGAGVGLLYTVPIGLATWWFGRVAGAVAVAACLGLYLLGTAIHHVSDLGVAVPIRAILFAAAWFGVDQLARARRHLATSAGQLDAVRSALIPPDLPALPDVDAAAAFLPAEHGVSGDFYVLTNAPDGSTVAVIGDVVGHGVAAAQLATFVRASLVSFAANTSDPAEVLMLTNRALCAGGEREDIFVTAACVSLEPVSARLTFAVAGHPAPIRLPDLSDLRPEVVGVPLGVDPDLSLHTASTTLGAGEGVLLYTDGATEARSEGKLLGERGMRDRLAPLARLPARELAGALQQMVVAYADERLRDDVCFLVLRPKTA
jgi:serine phosphatase RsbU (regulator of sigma subunit)